MTFLIDVLQFLVDVLLLIGIGYLLPLRKIARYIVGAVLLFCFWPVFLFLWMLKFAVEEGN